MIARPKAWLSDEGGASAVEFALVLTPMVLLLFGVMHLCLLVYSAVQLNYAAEATARCLVTSANSTSSSATCATTTAAQTYFKALYHGTTATPTFVTMDETQTCNTASTLDSAYQVVATANYVINAGVASKTVALTARACFPHT
jgi:Flp pilus assembly protein TadG